MCDSQEFLRFIEIYRIRMATEDSRLIVRDCPPMISRFRPFLFDILLDIFDILVHSRLCENRRALRTRAG